MPRTSSAPRLRTCLRAATHIHPPPDLRLVLWRQRAPATRTWCTPTPAATTSQAASYYACHAGRRPRDPRARTHSPSLPINPVGAPASVLHLPHEYVATLANGPAQREPTSRRRPDRRLAGITRTLPTARQTRPYRQHIVAHACAIVRER
ncbi:hypothetical protein C8T65DRAFT_831828 [Cerioporus squamosus]|nr:hypothetical protein C8T65DRAFT_831822 [Cerioporus squamosus]KAI0699765.1 hypothetical protein C8T65DRAFT_831828 [Cerioporus squamosus]